MTKRIGLVVAAVFAVAVIFAGARTFACGDGCKSGTKTASMTTANGNSCCPTGTSNTKLTSNSCSMTNTSETGSRGACGSKSKSAQYASGSCSSKGAKAEMTSGGCGASKSAKAEMAGGGCSSKMSNSAMAHAGCGTSTTKAAYAANVYEVRDGHTYAVCNGEKFEVTATTPYTEVGNARYYFANEESRVRCAEKMKSMASELDKEAVSLATAEANVVVDNGQKYGVCPVTNDKFLVTAESPAKVIDGQKYYVCSSDCASKMLHTADNPQSH